MSLAGNVKRHHFFTIVGLALVVLLGLIGLGLRSLAAQRAEQRAIEAEQEALVEAERLATQEEADRLAAAGQAERDAREASARAERAALEATMQGLRPVDRLLMLDWKGRSIPADKQKDVTKGKPWKVNVYQDAGQATVNRAKVDLDRDDRWDEKWTFEPDGGIVRQLAPRDDEDYSVQERWDGSAFVREG